LRIRCPRSARVKRRTSRANGSGRLTRSSWARAGPKGRGTWASPALLEEDLAFDIRGQDGRRFWGVTTLSGGGEKTDEPFIGELTGKDYRSFVFADTDGFWNGQLDGDDTLSFCYMHTHSKSTVVSCSQVKRTR
jgi:hypothetical protein